MVKILRRNVSVNLQAAYMQLKNGYLDLLTTRRLYPMMGCLLPPESLGWTMNLIFHPWQLLLLIWAAWINRDQQQALEFYRLQVEVLQEKLAKKRLLLNDNRRRRLAVKGKALGRKALRELTTIVTPDTILRWHRELVPGSLSPRAQSSGAGQQDHFTGRRGGADGRRDPVSGTAGRNAAVLLSQGRLNEARTP